jgi:hypothetical protein
MYRGCFKILIFNLDIYILVLKKLQIILVLNNLNWDGVICFTMKLLDSKIVEDILLENYFVRDVKGLNKKI